MVDYLPPFPSPILSPPPPPFFLVSSLPHSLFSYPSTSSISLHVPPFLSTPSRPFPSHFPSRIPYGPSHSYPLPIFSAPDRDRERVSSSSSSHPREVPVANHKAISGICVDPMAPQTIATHAEVSRRVDSKLRPLIWPADISLSPPPPPPLYKVCIVVTTNSLLK